jgi:hypothetical protein
MGVQVAIWVNGEIKNEDIVNLFMFIVEAW